MNIKLRSAVGIFLLTIGFSSSVCSQERHTQVLQDYITADAGAGFKKKDLQHFAITNIDPSQSLKGDVIKLQQIFNGFPVYGGVATAFYQDGTVKYYADNFEKDYQNATSKVPSISKETAFSKIFESAAVSGSKASYAILDFDAVPTPNLPFAKQRLMYFKKGNDLVLAYEFIFEQIKTPYYWNILVDAHTGEILSKYNLTNTCNFEPQPTAGIGFTEIPASKSNFITEKQPTVYTANNADDATYNVFPFPVESPTFGGRTVVTNPWMLTSSPLGWHNDGTNHYTITRGNNAFTYEDRASMNMPGQSPEGGATRNFNFPYSPNYGYVANQNASITQVFYSVNRVHDIFYKLGFTESARNFQHTNFGAGGIGNDAIIVEGQDGYGYNNAMFSNGPDGFQTKMITYLWDPPYTQHLFYNSPVSATTRILESKVSVPYPWLTATGVTGDVSLSALSTACSAQPASSLTGKIAMVYRTNSCPDTAQLLNLQNAGAAGVIFSNMPSYGTYLDPVIVSDPAITTPSVLITSAEGDYLESLINGGSTVNVTLKNDPTLTPHPDTNFDNGIIAHEYGHGISSRNTGDGYSCLNGAYSREVMNEGWSDFFLLMLTNPEVAYEYNPRGIGTYVINETPYGTGLRNYKYTSNLLLNPDKYGDFTFYDSHRIGAVWANILWELHWKYADKYGFSSDLTSNSTNGSTRAVQLVLDGLKLQECQPTFVSGRDAILAAEMNTTGGADRCMIWKVFARRGVGVNASAGSKTVLNDQVPDFTIPADCLLGTDEIKDMETAVVLYPNPARSEFQIKISNKKLLGKVKVDILDFSGKTVSSFHKVDLNIENHFNINGLPTGVYVVKISGLDFQKSIKLIKD